LIVREDDTFPAKSPDAGPGEQRRRAVEQALVTTTRRPPALGLTITSNVDLPTAIDAFLSQPDLASGVV